MNPSKEKILSQLKQQVQANISKAKEAFDTTKNHATEVELKAEGKYDTRSVEAGYLAGAQRLRVEELEQELALLEEIDVLHPPNEVSVGSLVEIELNRQRRLYFISSTSGGSLVNIDGQAILVISAFSPIGTEIIGLNSGEAFEVETPKELRQYLIKKIW